MADSIHTAPGSNTDMGDTGESVRQLNSLLRGEISAAETYRMAIDKVSAGDEAANAGLAPRNSGRARPRRARHPRPHPGTRRRSLRFLRRWGAWAKTVQGTMSLFGDSSSLKALKEGEEHGLKDYQEALDDVDATSTQLIQNQLIPAQQRHINLLDQLINSVAKA